MPATACLGQSALRRRRENLPEIVYSRNGGQMTVKKQLDPDDGSSVPEEVPTSAHRRANVCDVGPPVSRRWPSVVLAGQMVFRSHLFAGILTKLTGARNQRSCDMAETKSSQHYFHVSPHVAYCDNTPCSCTGTLKMMMPNICSRLNLKLMNTLQFWFDG